MNPFEYTPESHAITIAEQILGCERWEPPEDVVDKLKTVISPDKYGDIGEIEYFLKKWRLCAAAAHSVKISHLLTGEKSPFRLSSKGKRDLKRDFGKWYTEKKESGEKNPIIRYFVEEWLDSHLPDNPVNLRLQALEESVGKILERLTELEKRLSKAEKTLKSWE